MAIIKSFRELDVYLLAREQAKAIFTLSKSFPKEEKFSLTDQMRRSSRAVNAMIAEAWARRRYPAAFINKIDEALRQWRPKHGLTTHLIVAIWIQINIVLWTILGKKSVQCSIA
jgi:hypothetical protein